MAQGTRKGGAAAYLAQKNGPVGKPDEGAPKGSKRSMEDLKMQLPSGNAPQYGPPVNVQQQRSRRPAQIKGGDSNGDGHFYDTDAASIDGTSTAASLNDEAQHYGADEESEEYSSGVEEAQESEDDRMKRMDRDVKAGNGPSPRVISLPYTKGDSYPSTTSGNPSIPNSRDGGDAHDAGSHSSAQPGQRGLPNRQTTQRPSLAQPANMTKTDQPPTNATAAVQTRNESCLISRPDHLNQTSIEQQAAAGFAFGAAHKQQASANVPARNHQQRAVSNAQPSKPSKNTAQPSVGSLNGNRSNNVPAGYWQQIAEKSKDAAAPQTSIKSKNRQSFQIQAEQPPVHHQPIAPKAIHAQNVDSTLDDQHGNHTSPVEEPAAELDYSIAELQAMDYHTLKKEPFDDDPNVERFQVETQHDGTLSSKQINTIQASLPKNQTEFFQSLSISQWEQAGDWFLEQFSGVTGRLRDVRQQRRKAAHEFESEIEGRYKAVGQKRKQIDLALTEMRESGGKVLQGTPKKSKTK